MWYIIIEVVFVNTARAAAKNIVPLFMKGGLDMWSRYELKTRAKDVLRGTYWKAFLVSLVVAIVGGGNGGSAGSSSSGYRFSQNNFSSEFVGMMLIIGLLIIAIAFIFRWLIGYPLEVGGRKYFILSSQGDADPGYLGYAFQRGRYLNVILIMFYRGLLVFLWTLLLIIPGIIKSYAYRLVPYILADNPRIDYRRAIELSNQMTMGHKLEIFILDLSFIGWYLLGALALGIGVLFVKPYEDTTNAQLYIVLRKNALEHGMCTYEELFSGEESGWNGNPV
jgi:uncharacterized membrane protein